MGESSSLLKMGVAKYVPRRSIATWGFRPNMPILGGGDSLAQRNSGILCPAGRIQTSHSIEPDFRRGKNKEKNLTSMGLKGFAMRPIVDE